MHPNLDGGWFHLTGDRLFPALRSATSSEAEPKAPVSSTESDSDWRPPHPRPSGREINRSSSSRTHADKRTMDLRTAAELTAARDATYQNELWVRFR